MEKFWIFILVSFFATNSLEKTESVQLEETSLKIIDEIFGEGWWDNDKADEWDKLTLEHNFQTPPPNFGQNVHHQIDRQNTQIRQIEPNSTDQNAPLTESDHSGQIEPSTDQNPPLIESDHSGQIEPNSTDQNPPNTEADHSENAENGKERMKEMTSNENNAEDEQKRKIVAKFHEMKDEFKQKGKYSAKEWNQIEARISKHLKINRKKIYEWKYEFGLSQKKPKNELIKKFDQMKAELKRDGFKNSYKNEMDKTVAKELGLSFVTIYNWKRKLGQTKPNHKYPHSEQKELMKSYYEIKNKNPKTRDADMAKMLKIGTDTLVRWKRQFKRQHFQPNSVDVGHSVEENAAANVQQIDKSNSGSI